MTRIFITQKIQPKAEEMLKAKGYDVVTSSKSGVLTKAELIAELKKSQNEAVPYDAILSLLTNKIDGDVFDAAPAVKIVSNYAVGFDNIDLDAAKKRGVKVANAPGLSSQSVAEHTMGLLLSLAMRIVEGDRYVRAGSYQGWNPDIFWGTDVTGKTLGLIGAGNIGSMVARRAKGFEMNIIYYDVKRNERMEAETSAQFQPILEDLLKEADFVSVHVPLLPTTRHLINKEHFSMMKKTALLINTSRGAVIDEVALVDALKNSVIRGAAIDVFENEPVLTSGLINLQNIILTPHIGSATEKTRESMSVAAAENIIDFFEGRTPARLVV